MPAAPDLLGCPNLLALLRDQAEALADRPFLWRKRDGAYQPLTWREVADTIGRVAAGLSELGVAAGDRVMLVGENRPEWLMTDLGIMAAGGVTVPAYTTNTEDDHRHILRHSGAVGAVVSSPALARTVIAAAADAPGCRWIVVMDDGLDDPGHLPVHRWADLAATAGGDRLDRAAGTLRRGDLAGFIYTSGTSGRPKAVMLSHGSALSNCHGARALLADFDLSNEVFLSFLPASHAYERTLGQFLPIALGAQIYYGEGIEALARNIDEARPTLLACVPRMLDAMRQRIERTVAREGGMKARLFNQTLDLGRRRHTGTLGVMDRVTDAMLERLVRETFRARFGGRVKALVSAGAALDPEVGLFFTAMGLPVLQGYGQTEAGPMISGNTPERPRMDSVGRPIETTELRIAGDGEILVRGEGVMLGYWNDPAATAEAIRDGWLHTGDIGVIDPDGHVRITDRKKDIIVLSGGDNVSPARIETVLAQQPAILQAAVFGDDADAGLTAVVVPDPEFVKTLPDEDTATVQAAMRRAVDDANRGLGVFERVRAVVVADEPFTIAQGLLTPTLKIRRHLVRQRYAEQLKGRR